MQDRPFPFARPRGSIVGVSTARPGRGPRRRRGLHHRAGAPPRRAAAALRPAAGLARGRRGRAAGHAAARVALTAHAASGPRGVAVPDRDQRVLRPPRPARADRLARRGAGRARRPPRRSSGRTPWCSTARRSSCDARRHPAAAAASARHLCHAGRLSRSAKEGRRAPTAPLRPPRARRFPARSHGLRARLAPNRIDWTSKTPCAADRHTLHRYLSAVDAPNSAVARRFVCG